MKLGLKGGLALGGLALTLGLVLAWNPTNPLRTRALAARAEAAIKAREVQITPLELATLLQDRRVPIRLYDLRSESAYNRFHLADARHLPAGRLDRLTRLPPTTIKVLIGDGEQAAERAYAILASKAVPGVYLLEGGIQSWLRDYGSPEQGSERILGLALGGRHPASLPPVLHGEPPPFSSTRSSSSAAERKRAGAAEASVWIEQQPLRQLLRQPQSRILRPWQQRHLRQQP